MKTETKKSTGLVARIMAMLNLGEAGKIQHFVDKQIKSFTREKDQLLRNIEIEEYNSKIELEKLEEELEDAILAVESEYTNIRVKDINTNADQDSFAKTFWSRIRSAEGKVKSIEAKIKDHKERTEKEIDSIKEEIAVRENYISKLS
jgi:hypothetical protein